MIKNLFKRNMIVIFAIAFLCTAIVTYSFIRSSSSTNAFTQSGYVHVNSNESEDKRVLFSSGQKYKSSVNSQIKFTDVSNTERSVQNDNFIHYDDNSIAAFTDGTIVNIDELTKETSTMNHFHIAPGMTLANTGTSYTAENSGMEIDFANFLWKVSDNKYLLVSKSINVHFSDTDERECSNYAEIQYLDGKVIQIQTEDNIWQTISDECKLTLNNGYVCDLSMKNIKDPQGNVVLDFSRIVIDSNNNIELTPMDNDMEALSNNVIPHFTVNNTPGDSGEDGYSGVDGGDGESGDPGNKGLQGNEGLSGEREGEGENNVIKFPIFSLSDWHVEATKCWGDIIVQDDKEVLAPETSSLVSKIYLIDLDTGENIYEDRIQIVNGVPRIDPGTYDFRGVRNNSSAKVSFSFDGLKTDHSYMLYASAPLKISDDTDTYSRGFLTKTFWTDSTGVYMENAKVESHAYQVLIHNNNTHSGVGVYILDKPISDYATASTITLEQLNNNTYPVTELWPYNSTSGASVEANKTKDYTVFVNSSGSNEQLHSNSHYYTILAYDLDGTPSTFEDYSVQILSTLTLKEKPVVDAPRITSNRNIWGFDVNAGILTDVDNGVTKVYCEFYELTEDNFENYADYIATNPDGTRKIDSSLLVLKEGVQPTRTIEIGNVSSAAVSLGGSKSGEYVCRELLTVYDNEKEYQVTSKFSNAAELVASTRPYVYFEQFATQQTGTSSAQNKYSQSPFYDSIFGMLHISPGTDAYKYAVNSNARVEISGESYYYSYPIKMVDDTTSGDNGIYLKAQVVNGDVQVRFPDYKDSDNSWASGLKPGQTYHITVYGDLYDGNTPNYEVDTDSELIKEYSAEVGHCDITTPQTTTMFMAMSTKPNSDDLTKNLAIGLANPTLLRNKLNITKTAAEEDQYYRQMDTLYGVRVSVYLGNYEEEYIWQKSTDTEVVPGKKYYAVGTNGAYEEVPMADIPNPNSAKNPSTENWYEKSGETYSLSTDTSVVSGKKYYTKTGTDTYEEVSFASTPNPNKSKNPSTSMWFEYVYNTLPEVWTSKLFTAGTPWTVGTTNPTQLYRYYDSEMPLFADGVQVTTEVLEGKTVLVRTTNGEIPAGDKVYIYNKYDYDETNKVYTPNNADGKVVLNDDGSIGDTTNDTKRLKKLYTIDRLTDVDVSKSVTDNITDYKVESGGIVLTQNDFMVGNLTFEQAVLDDEIGAIAQNYTGATFIVEELYDYTGNNNDRSLNNQRNVRVLSTDTSIQNSSTYYKKNGETYTPVIINGEISPKNARWYTVDSEGNYSLTTDDTMVTDGSKRYYDLVDAANQRYELVPQFAGAVSPKALGWYEDTDQHYTNYFNVEGETRIFIPFVRNIGYIDIKEPYRTASEGDGRIERKSTDDGYHYFYTAQAKFSNSSLLADSITYYVYDSVDFFNTKKFKNNSTDFVNWSILGKDPRSDDPTSGIKNSWVIQNIQTISTDPNDKREFVYELIDVSTTAAVEKILNPYLYGWYENTATAADPAADPTGGDYYITNAKTINEANHTYFIDKGPGAADFESFNPVATDPQSMGLFVEHIQTTDNTTIHPSTIYYALVLDRGEETYKVIDTKTVSPAGFGWYQKDASNNYYFSSDTSVDPGHTYFYYNGSDYSPVSNPGSMTIGNVNPQSLGWYYGQMSKTTDTSVDSNSRYYVKLLINVHSDENKLNSGAYSNFDTTISPISVPYYEKEKVKTTLTSCYDTTGNLVDTTFYSTYEGEYGTCFEVVDLTKNSNSSKNPLSEEWYEDKPGGTYVASNDKYYDINKTYYDNGGNPVTNISPATQKWFEAKKETVAATETTIDYSKNYYKADGTPIDLNINPSALGWKEKTKVAATDTKVMSGTTYYYHNDDGTYSKINTTNYNPFALGWKEIKYTLELEDETVQPTAAADVVDYYARKSDGTFVEVYADLTNPAIDPQRLGWMENKFNNETLSYSKVPTPDNTITSATKEYYAPIGQTYVKVTASTATPKLLGWFKVEQVASTDTSLVANKDYYSAAGDKFDFTADVDVAGNGHVDPSVLGWFVDAAGATYDDTTDTKYDSGKTYYFTNTAGTTAQVTLNPYALEWCEEVYELSTDTDLSNIGTKQYYVRYLTNNYATTAVTTEGLELAKITIPFDGKTITPTVNFYPCTYEYAKETIENGDPYGLESALDTQNSMFLYPDSTEEMYGHQFVFAWTLNYHSYLDESWHYSYPYDATTKQIIGAATDVRFVDMALGRNSTTFVNGVASMGADSFDDSQTTPLSATFGANAYMVIPHNYKLFDEPKKVPSVYSLQWSSGVEQVTSGGSTQDSKYIINRALIYDPYKAVNGTSSSLDTTSSTATLINGTSTRTLSSIKANTKLTAGFTNGNAVKNLVNTNANLVSTDGYAINEVKVSAYDMSQVGASLYDTSTTPAHNGDGDAKIYLPVQLYSNKYVNGNQSIHTGHNYYTGSSELGSSDVNWKFKETTTNNDRYSSLLTAVFFPDVTLKNAECGDLTDGDALNHESELLVKPKTSSGKQVGYYAELVLPAKAKLLLDEIVGIRLRFDVYDYEIVGKDQYQAPAGAASSEPNPNALKLYEKTITKDICKEGDTTVVENRLYFAKSNASDDDYTKQIINPGKTGGTAIEPMLWGLYDDSVAEGVPAPSTTNDYTEFTPDPENREIKYWYPDGTTEFYKDNISPYAMGWKYAISAEGDVIPTEDTTWNDNKTYCTQKDIIYSLFVDKYLKFKVNEVEYEKDQYGALNGETAVNKVDDDGDDTDGQIHIYFAISNDDIKSDSNYEIGDTFNKMISGKSGIHLSAQYLFEGDQAGYSYIKFGNVNNPDTRRDNLSNKANGIINNKDLGTFALRTYSFIQNAGQNYFSSQNRNWDVPADTEQTSVPSTVYDSTEVKFKKFGSFYQVGGIASDEPKVFFKTTREGGSTSSGGTVFSTYQKDINSEIKAGVTYYVPTLLKTISEVKVKTSLLNADGTYSVTKQPEVILDFPSGDQFVTFNTNLENDGAIVKRQNVKLKFGFNGIPTSEAANVYALVTTTDILQYYGDKEYSQVPIESYNSLYFDHANTASSSQVKNVIGLINDGSSVEPVNAKLNSKGIYKKLSAPSGTQLTPANYFSDIRANGDGVSSLSTLDYEKMFIKVAGVSDNETIDLGAVPYPTDGSVQDYYVTFWKWVLLNSEENTYGWERIPYSVDMKYDVSLHFQTTTPSYPSLTAHYDADEYENKYLNFGINTLADDAYYIVDLFDKKENKIVSYLKAESTYGPTGINYTVDVDRNLVGVDTSDHKYIVASKENGVQPAGGGKYVSLTTGAGDYKFEYGKNGASDRYAVELRSYLLGTGPAAGGYSTDDAWASDLDSLYNTYQYAIAFDPTAKTFGAVTLDKEHHVMTAPDTVARKYEFSVNNEFDGVNILRTNSSNLKTTPTNVKEAFIEFSLENWVPKSYSIYKEIYIPVVVIYGKDSHQPKHVFKLDDLDTAAVNAALEDGTHLGKTTVGGISTLNFNDNKNPVFRFYTDEVNSADITQTKYKDDYVVGDYVTLYIFGLQDDISTNKEINLNNVAGFIEEFVTNAPHNNFTEIPSGTPADQVAGVRVIAAATEEIKNKSVEVFNVKTTLTSSVVQKYHDVAVDYRDETAREAVVRASLQGSKSVAEASKNKLVSALKKYREETSAEKKDSWIQDNKGSFIQGFNAVADVTGQTPLTPEDPRVNANYEQYCIDNGITYNPAEDYYKTKLEERFMNEAAEVVKARGALYEAIKEYGYGVNIDANGAYVSDGPKVYVDGSGNITNVNINTGSLIDGTTGSPLDGTKDLYYNDSIRYGYYDVNQVTANEVYVKITDTDKYNTAISNKWIELDGGKIQVLPAADGHITQLGVEVCSKDTPGAIKIDGVVQNIGKKKHILETTGSIKYKVNIDLEKCEGATPFGDLTYTISFMKGTTVVGSLTKTVSIAQNPTTKNFGVDIPIASGTDSTLKDTWTETDHNKIVVTVKIKEATNSPITAAKVEGVFAGTKITIMPNASFTETADDRFKPPVFEQQTAQNIDGFVNATYTFEMK